MSADARNHKTYSSTTVAQLTNSEPIHITPGFKRLIDTRDNVILFSNTATYRGQPHQTDAQ
jgi:hypothetical protein